VFPGCLEARDDAEIGSTGNQWAEGFGVDAAARNRLLRQLPYFRHIFGIELRDKVEHLAVRTDPVGERYYTAKQVLKGGCVRQRLLARLKCQRKPMPHNSAHLRRGNQRVIVPFHRHFRPSCAIQFRKRNRQAMMGQSRCEQGFADAPMDQVFKAKVPGNFHLITKDLSPFPNVSGSRRFPDAGRPGFRLKSWMKLAGVMKKNDHRQPLEHDRRESQSGGAFQPGENDRQANQGQETRGDVGAMMREVMASIVVSSKFTQGEYRRGSGCRSFLTLTKLRAK
jgi:hypothetical protein